MAVNFRNADGSLDERGGSSKELFIPRCRTEHPMTLSYCQKWPTMAVATMQVDHRAVLPRSPSALFLVDMTWKPRICCLDLDTFFVSVERLLDPSLEVSRYRRWPAGIARCRDRL